MQKWFIEPLALTGHSKGAYSVVHYAEKYPHDLGYLVSVAPVVNGQLSFEAYQRRDPEDFAKWERDGILVKTESDGKTRIRYWSQMEERLQHDLFPDAQKLTMPTLFIVGSCDELCPPTHIKILFDAMLEGNKTMKIIEGAPHSYYEKSEQDACRNFITEWLKNHQN